MERVLEQHEDMIDKHEDRLEKIQTDLTDIKTRLGIKDFTNGQVVRYQEQLVENQRVEMQTRKEQDAMILDRLDKLDERIWYLAVGVIMTIVLEVGIALIF